MRCCDTGNGCFLQLVPHVGEIFVVIVHFSCLVFEKSYLIQFYRLLILNIQYV
uniref:Uncharacterized protein n=1 Tax=Octopus bimaculoides TaxID=37653 RepID=A0A0L8IFT2_OCTBM